MTRTLWDVLCAIADRRGRKGRQLPLSGILAIAIAAMLAGANDLRAIFRWGRRLTPEALALFGLERAPCHATYHYVFKSLDGDVLAKALGEFARGDAAASHIAIDGKTLKGSRRLDAKAPHVVAAFATELSCVVGDLVVAPDQNEITAALALLKELKLDGAIITGDAIFCRRAESAPPARREICRTVKDGNGDYLFAVKDNQPELKAAIAESFGDLPPPARPAAPPPYCRLTSPVPRRWRRHTAASRPDASRSAPRSSSTSTGVHAKHGSGASVMLLCQAGGSPVHRRSRPM